MPRIRTIKPDAFLSESLSTVDRGTRWTFAGLWTYADDKGRARDDARLIKAALYPLDDWVTLADVTHDLAKLAAIGAVCRYVVEDRSYLHMPKWGEHQRINRPTPARNPPCPLHEGGTSGHALPADPSVIAHGALSESSTWEVEVEVDVEGEGEGSLSSDKSDHAHLPPRFEEFWETYGNKVGRAKSLVAYRKALKKPGVTEALLIDTAAAYVLWCRQTDTFVKNPLTWLNGEHWADDLPAVKAPQGRSQQWLQLAADLGDTTPPENVRQIGPAR